MSRAVTLFTGQWADLPLDTMVKKAKEFGYDGVELACWGDHFEVDKADSAYCSSKRELLESHGMKCFAISTHLVGQAVCDNIDERHKQILPDYIYGDGEPESVRQRAAEEIMKTAKAAKEFGVNVVNGSAGTFCGATDSVLLTVFVDQSADCTTGGIINAGDTTGPDGYKSLSTPCGETEQCADYQHGEMFRPSKHYVLSDLNE